MREENRQSARAGVAPSSRPPSVPSSAWDGKLRSSASREAGGSRPHLLAAKRSFAPVRSQAELGTEGESARGAALARGVGCPLFFFAVAALDLAEGGRGGLAHVGVLVLQRRGQNGGGGAGGGADLAQREDG